MTLVLFFLLFRGVQGGQTFIIMLSFIRVYRLPENAAFKCMRMQYMLVPECEHNVKSN